MRRYLSRHRLKPLRLFVLFVFAGFSVLFVVQRLQRISTGSSSAPEEDAKSVGDVQFKAPLGSDSTDHEFRLKPNQRIGAIADRLDIVVTRPTAFPKLATTTVLAASRYKVAPPFEWNGMDKFLVTRTKGSATPLREMKKKTRRKSEKKNNGTVCGMKSACGTGKVGYSINSGAGIDTPPRICVDDVDAISGGKKNFGRGINVAIFDVDTEKVTKTRTFDTYSESDLLTQFLQRDVDDGKILLMSSYDDVNNALNDLARTWLKKFGSKKIGDLKFRGSWAMVGQRGLESTTSEALDNPVETPNFGKSVHLEGCFDIPEIGPMTIVGVPDRMEGVIEKGTRLQNCGSPQPCPNGEYSFHLLTGKENKEYPRICFNGVYYMEKGVNDAGRGLNVIVIDGSSKEVVKRGTFDIFEKDSTDLEIFMSVLRPTDVFVAVTFDDATKNMGPLAKKLLTDVGATQIERMASHFRSAYVLVTSKTSGAVLEQTSKPTSFNAFAPPIELRTCLKV